MTIRYWKHGTNINKMEGNKEMALSIEILVIGVKQISLKEFNYPFVVVTSFPPRSHRGVSSLWQSEFDAEGGVLVHIGDPNMSHRNGLFWAYEILEEIELRRYRLTPRCRSAFFELPKKLLSISPSKKILFTSDSQFGPKKYRYRREYTINSLEKLHNKSGLRLNSSVYIKA